MRIPPEARRILETAARSGGRNLVFTGARHYEDEFQDAMAAYWPGYEYHRELRAGAYPMRFDFVGKHNIAELVVPHPRSNEGERFDRIMFVPTAVYSRIVRLAVAQRTAVPPRAALLVFVVPNEVQTIVHRLQRTVWEAATLGIETYVVESVMAAAELLYKKEIDAVFPDDEDDGLPPED